MDDFIETKISRRGLLIAGAASAAAVAVPTATLAQDNAPAMPGLPPVLSRVSLQVNGKR
ncbi:MAG: aldehyde dehydrogenase iron-sulfur subunit, partial [Telluria sp.]